MRVFIGMKVPREEESLRRLTDRLAAAIKSAGHQPFVAPDEIAQCQLEEPRDFMPFVRQSLREAELVILLNHPELRGGLIETGMAYAWEIPVWLCHQPGKRVSGSVRGCAAETIEYADLDELRDELSRRLLAEGKRRAAGRGTLPYGFRAN